MRQNLTQVDPHTPQQPGARSSLTKWEETSLAVVVECYADVVISKSVAGVIVNWSESAQRMFGYPAAEVIGRPITIIVPPERREEEIKILDNLRQGAVQLRETVRLAKDGSRIDVSLTVVPIRDASGAVVGASSIMKDISERKRAEIIQRDFQALFESAPGQFLVLKPEHFEIAAASAGYLTATMTRRENILGCKFFDVFPDDPDDPLADGARNLRASLERVKTRKQADVMPLQRYPIRRPKDDGGSFEERWWSPINSPVYGPSGDLLYIIHRVEDVTPFVKASTGESSAAAQGLLHQMAADIVARAHELIRLNEALREDDQRLRLALETGGLGYYERDLVSNVVSGDPRWRSIMGLPPGPVDPDFAPKSLYPEDRARVLARVARAFDPRLREICSDEFRIITPSGELKWIAAQGRVTFDDNANPPRPLKFLGVVRDINDQKTWENQLAQTKEHLEKTVEERTANLKDSIAELEQFSYTLVHDMRAPLRTLQGFSQILLDEAAPSLQPEHRDYLRRIVAGAERMDHLIVDALSYSKLVHEELALTPVNVNTLLTGIVESYPTFRPPHALIQIDSPMPKVIANIAGLTQCFGNLLTNAVKFVTPGQTPQVRIRAEERGDRVRFWVEDNGIGIASEHLSRIFGMFQQLSRDYPGTGIGLAVARKAVERMQGTIGVESQPGQGSRFWLEFKKA